MRRLLAMIASAGLLTGVVAVPAAAVSSRIAAHCEEIRITEWTGGREWIDENLVYHVRGQQAVYRHEGDAYCAGLNYATVSVDLDLTTGEGSVRADAQIVLDAFASGWDSRLVAHFTPAGPHIWEGKAVGQGFGAISGWQYRADVVEVTHELAIDRGFAFRPGQ